MGKTKSCISGACLLTAGLVGVVALSSRTRADDRPRAEDGAWMARIDQRVQAWQPTRDERRLDEVGCAEDIRDALRLAREHRRPIFLFTYSGSSVREHALALQRC